MLFYEKYFTMTRREKIKDLFSQENFGSQIEILKELTILHNGLENPVADLNNFCLKQWNCPPTITSKPVGTASEPQMLVEITLPNSTTVYAGQAENKKAAKTIAAKKALEAINQQE